MCGGVIGVGMLGGWTGYYYTKRLVWENRRIRRREVWVLKIRLVLRHQI